MGHLQSERCTVSLSLSLLLWVCFAIDASHPFSGIPPLHTNCCPSSELIVFTTLIIHAANGLSEHNSDNPRSQGPPINSPKDRYRTHLVWMKSSRQQGLAARGQIAFLPFSDLKPVFPQCHGTQDVAPMEGRAGALAGRGVKALAYWRIEATRECPLARWRVILPIPQPGRARPLARLLARPIIQVGHCPLVALLLNRL